VLGAFNETYKFIDLLSSSNSVSDNLLDQYRYIIAVLQMKSVPYYAKHVQIEIKSLISCTDFPLPYPSTRAFIKDDRIKHILA